MENDSDTTRSFYRKDYKPNRQRYFIIALIIAAASLAVYIFFFHGRDRGVVEGLGDIDSTEISQNSDYRDRGNEEQQYADSREYRSDSDEGFDTDRNGIAGNLETDNQISYDDQTGNVTLKVGKKKIGLISVADVKGENLEIFKKANNELAKLQFRSALKLYEQLPGVSPAVQLCKGLCYYELDDWYSAIDHLEQAREAIDNSGEDKIRYLSLHFLALTHYQLNNLEESLQCAEQALTIEKDRQLMALRNKLKRELNALEDYGTTERVNFNIVFSKMEHYGTKQKVVEYLEDAYRTIGRQMDFYPSETINVILYNEKNFFDVTRSPGWAGGLYDGKIRIPIGRLESFPGFEEMLKRILFHEYSHALVHRITRANRCPVWFDEGLAEYFSDDHGQKIKQIIPLNYLERGFPSSGRAVAVAYVESYSAISYIIDRYKCYSVKEFLAAMGEGVSFKKAFKKAFAIEYSRFLETWGKD